MFLTFLVLSLTATLSLGSGLGKCPKREVQADFDLEKFSGTWYELESSASLEKISRKCSSFLFEFKSENKASLLHTYINVITNKKKSEYSDVNTPKTSEPAKLQISPLKGTILARKWPLWIIETDYESYAIGYTCSQKIVSHIESVYIFSRTKTLDSKKKMELYDLLKNHKLPQKNLIEVDQEHKDCE